MGKDQELLEAARKGNVAVVDKILGQRAKRSGPLASLRRGPGANVQDSSGYSALHHAALNGHRYGSRRRPRRRCTYVTRCLQGDRQAPAGARRLGQHRRREGVVAAALGRLVGKRRYRQVAAERTIDLQCELDDQRRRNGAALRRTIRTHHRRQPPAAARLRRRHQELQGRDRPRPGRPVRPSRDRRAPGQDGPQPDPVPAAGRPRHRLPSHAAPSRQQERTQVSGGESDSISVATGVPSHCFP
jgi:hypothetical protein